MSTILHQRSHALLLSKPSGIPVFSREREDSVAVRLLAEQPRRRDISWPEGFAAGIAHRLDTATTGGLLAASDLEQLVAMRLSFTEKRFRKTYRFLSAKEPRWEMHACHASLAHDKRKRGNMIPKRGKNTPHRGKWYDASTSFRHLARQDGISVWEAEMYSGVMHQIRVHAAFLGIALLGDRRYGGGVSPSWFAGDFALHHRQIGDWPVVPPPSWWPIWAQKI